MRYQSLIPLFLASCCTAYHISVAATGGNTTSSLQYGLMVEEINHALDGGIYAELVRNRAFQGNDMFPSNLHGWEPVNDADLTLKNLTLPLSSALKTSVNVRGTGRIGLRNLGWWGIEVKPQVYTGSFYVKGKYHGRFTVALESLLDEQIWSKARVRSRSVTHEWTQHTFTLEPRASAPTTNNSLSITFDAGAQESSLDFNLISLFPPTWNNRPNGLRVDLVEAISQTSPKFLRYPGGSNVQGNSIDTRWKWYETIGPLKDRPGRPSFWEYMESTGLGLIEFMEWCQDLNMEPILGVWGGMTGLGEVVPKEELQMYVQEALDEIEFLTGDVTTKYGAIRGKLGYPQPWDVHYVEIGNEDYLSNGLESYKAYRFQAFHDAIKAKYPDITVISTSLNMTLPSRSAGDYHLYEMPDNMVEAFDYFDGYDTSHPILLGEIASFIYNNEHGFEWADRQYSLYPWWIGSVAEAVFLLGAERNADKIIGATFAPCLLNINSFKWAPTFLAFSANSSETARSTSWHVYNLLSNAHITHTLPAASSSAFGPLYWVAGENHDEGTHIFKAAVYNSTHGGDVPVTVSFEGVAKGALGELTILTAPDAYSKNKVGAPNLVNTNVSVVLAGRDGTFAFSLPDLSVAVLKTWGSAE